MENLSKKPPYRNNAHYGSTKSVYDDVFGGPPRFGAPTLSPRPEDYAEIFGGFRGGSRAAATSIPVLDLPPADGAGLLVPFMGRHFDYSEVFGGSNGLDYLVSFEELMEGSKSGAVYDSSDEAWTPAQSETMSNESEPFPCLYRYESMPNAEFHISNDNMKQFKVSYNKVFLTSEDDVANGVAHVAQLNDIPGYSFLVNDTAPIQKMVVTNNLKHEDLSGGLGEGKQLRKSHSCEIKPFVTISDISLRTLPSHLPPPARPPPIIGPKNKESDTQNSKFKASRSFAFGETTSDDDSSLYHDVQVDASSAAAISAAAMKDVMEKAEAKLKSAKNKKERNNKEAKICGETSERDLNGVNKRFSDNARKHGKGYRLLQESSSKNEGYVEWKQDDEFFEVVETDVSRNSENYEHRREKRGSRAISQKEEVNRKMKSDNDIHEKIIVEAVDGEDFENITKETEYQQRCEGDLSLKENVIKLRENVERERYEKSLKEAAEREKLENEKKERKVWEREEKEKIEKETRERELEEKRAKEAIEKEENEKRIRIAREEKDKKQREDLEREEKEKREKEAREKEFEEKRLREAIEKEETEKRLRLAVEEKERKQREAREREEKEREKEAREREEMEKREKEAREQEAEEKRRKKALEEREKEQREAFEREEKEKREYEAREKEMEEKRLREAAIEQEEKEKRLKIALEKEENEKKKNLALKRDEAEKKLKDEQNIEEEPNDTPRKGKNKEKVKEECELEEATPKVKEIHERENTENSSREDFDQEEIDKMWEEDYKLNENVSFCGAADKVDKNIREVKKTKESFSLEDPIIIEVKVGDLNSSDVARDDLQHNKSENKMGEVKELFHMHDTVFEFDKKPLKKTVNFEKPVFVNHDKKDEKIASSQEVKTKVQRQNEERKSKNLEKEREERMSKERELENERLRKIEEEQEREREREVKAKVQRKNLEKEREERMNRERELENERLRKIEEEKEREREREKDRTAVDMASLERVAVEAKLRRERAAVERATAEARERAFQKAKTDKATIEARERIERMRQSSSRSDLCQGVGSNNGSLKASSLVSGGVEVESAQRCKARLERHQRTAQRAAKALEEKNMRDLIAQRELAERNRLAEGLDAEVRRWSSGKEGNLRALLSTLQYILGPNSGWQPIHLTGVITSEAVKKAYRKATLCVHPDKLQQRGASIHQKYVCEKVFDLLKAAWNKFNSEER